MYVYLLCQFETTSFLSTAEIPVHALGCFLVVQYDLILDPLLVAYLASFKTRLPNVKQKKVLKNKNAGSMWYCVVMK